MSLYDPSSAATVGDELVLGAPPQSPSPLSRRLNSSPSWRRDSYNAVNKPPIDLRQVDYVSAVDRNLICPICHCPFDHPVRVPSCNHYFCADCIQEAFRLQSSPQRTCPSCRSECSVRAEPAEKLIQTILDDLIIKCPTTELGCSWIGKRCDVQDHVERYCDYTMVDCPLRDCSRDITRKDAGQGCLHHIVQCQYCQMSLLRSDLEVCTQSRWCNLSN
jgi:hypothetical protein